MTASNRTRPRSLTIAYISMFAALNVLADFIPLTPILGIPGSSLSFGWIMAPLTGILLGMEMGTASCLIGGLVGILLGQPLVFGFFTPFRPALSAFIAGTLVSKKWYVSALTLLVLISTWLLLPIGRDAAVILVFHIAGLAIILLLRGRISVLIRSEKPKTASSGYLLTAYCGNISRHLFGNILSVLLLNLQPIFFISAIPYTFFEQLIFSIGAAIVGASLSRLRLREFLRSS